MTVSSESRKQRSSRERSGSAAHCICSVSVTFRLAATAHQSRLSLGLAAAGPFGVFDRAEPARALADLHLDLRIPAAGGLVIDAFAGAVDVALDGSFGRG